MKICILTHTFPRFNGDTAAPFMGELAIGMVGLGNEVYVLTPYSPKFNLSEKRPYKIITFKYIFWGRLHKMGYSQTLTNDMGIKPLMFFLSPLLFLFGFIALYKLVKEEKIDIINAHWILPNGFIASFASFLTGVPLVSTLPGSDVYLAGKNFVFSLMATFAAKVSAAITSNSPQLIDDLVKLGVDRNKCSAIIYGVDPTKFKPDQSKNLQLRKKYGISKDKIIILSVGRLVAKKGFKYLIEAALKVLKIHKKVVFMIVGDGDQRKELENLIRKSKLQSNFLLIGWVNYEELSDYYNLADIFILPSIRDERGNLDDQSVSLVEAMACGKAVITTNFPGYKTVVKDGINGFLVAEKNDKEIAKAILTLTTFKLLRDKMGANNRKLTVDKFSWKEIGRQYTQLFKSIANK